MRLYRPAAMFSSLTPADAARFRTGIAHIRAASSPKIATALLDALAREFGVPAPWAHSNEYRELAEVTVDRLPLPLKSYAEHILYDGARADAEDIAMATVSEIIGIPDSKTVYDRTKGKGFISWAYARVQWRVLDRNKRANRGDRVDEGGSDEGRRELLDATRALSSGAEFEELRSRIVEDSVTATCRAFPKMLGEGPEFLKALGEGIFLDEWYSYTKTAERKRWDRQTYDRYKKFHERNPKIVVHFERELLVRVASALGETFD
ncbi:MAG: hypothetical protein ABMA01_01790 [Chthoniobacteraceae bacterium]